MARNFRWARAMLLTAVTSLAACSDDSAGDGDSGAPRSDANNDTSATDSPAGDLSTQADAADSSLDNPMLDALDTNDGAMRDAAGDPFSDEAAGDSACTCTLIDSGLPVPF